MENQMFGNLGLHVIQFPSKRYGFVGSIPTTLGKMIPASTSAVLGCRAFRSESGELVEWKFPSFESREQAIAFAESKGETVIS